MKLMITLNVKKLISGYNTYSKAFNLKPMTDEMIYNMLDDIYGGYTYSIARPEYVIMSTTELERFANMLNEDIWHEIVIDNASSLWFIE